MISQASQLAKNPALQRLIQRPDLLDAVKEQDPALKQLLEQNPGMAELLAPDKMRSVLSMLNDPATMLAGGPAVFGGMNLMEQQQVNGSRLAYSILHRRTAGEKPGGKTFDGGSGTESTAVHLTKHPRGSHTTLYLSQLTCIQAFRPSP